MKKMNRRTFLRLSGASAVMLALSACEDEGITVADVQGKTYWAAYIMRTPQNPTNDE